MIHETTEGIEFESSEPGKGASVKQEPDGSSISYREKGFAEIKRMNKHQVRSIGATIENMNKRKRT